MASLCKNVKCEQWRQQGFCYCDHTFTVLIILSSLSNSLLCSLLIASFSRIPWLLRVFLFQLPRTPISNVNFCHSKESLLKEEKSENYISLFFFLKNGDINCNFYLLGFQIFFSSYFYCEWFCSSAWWLLDLPSGQSSWKPL